MKPGVVIADAAPLERLAVRMALLDGQLTVAAEVETAAAGLNAVLEGAEVLLLDEDLDPHMETVSEVARAAPNVSVIVLSSTGADTAARTAIAAGACGFVTKDTPVERLPAIVHGVVAGEAAFSRRLVRSLLGDLRAVACGAGDQHPLSRREREVLQLLARGMADCHVSQHLGVSEVTVRRHASAAARKFGVDTRRQAIDLFATTSP